MPETFLDADTIRANAAGSGWSPVTVVASTGSTNADLAALAREGAPGGTVLIAGHQSSGRGRLARPWVAPPDTSLACSVLVDPRRGTADWGWLPLLVGMAVSDGIREETGVDARLKWPNDVLVGDRKLSGILCEAVTVGPRATAVLGFGINVTLGADQLPVPTATSTALEGSGSSGTAIVSAVLGRLADRYAAWDRARTSSTRTANGAPHSAAWSMWRSGRRPSGARQWTSTRRAVWSWRPRTVAEPWWRATSSTSEGREPPRHSAVRKSKTTSLNRAGASVWIDCPASATTSSRASGMPVAS